MSESTSKSIAPPVLASRDIVAGLGAAPRELLAACLALFDDSTLQSRIGTLVNRFTSKKGKNAQDTTAPSDEETIAAVHESLRKWQNSPLSDGALRVLLWMYLREAFALQPVTFASLRSAGTAADDIVARALHSLQPGTMTKLAEQCGLKEKKQLPTTLDTLARQTMEELMASFLQAEDAQSKQAREELLAETRARLAQLQPDDRERLMQAVGADDVNDAALRNILLTGGGLGAFSASVSLAGFSAYILAAQASAFIPLVSGPALVSVVAVLSNPITIIAATAGMGWWATRSANQKVRGAVGVRVLSLLALNGLEAGASGIRAMIDAFSGLENLRQSGELSSTVLAAYRSDWSRITPARGEASTLDPAVAKLMEQPANAHGAANRLGAVIDANTAERRNTLALAGLTLADILYSAFSIDPAVLQAADFSRTEDLDDPVQFAAFAHRIEDMDPSAHLGAVSNLKGYVAERVVAARLVDQGHVVEFPATSNQAGWDLSVDGIKFQVKDMEDLSGLQRHFDLGNDYPIIANSELAAKLEGMSGDDLPAWADKVHFVEGYSNEVVEHVTRSSLDAGDDMLHPDVPLFTLVLSGIRNVGRMNRNEITGTQAVQEVLLDGGTRAGLAIAGNYVGVGVGLLLFGPAGALVLGAVAPIVSQRQSGLMKGKLDEWVKDDTYRAWEEMARKALSALLDKVEKALSCKTDLLKGRRPDETQAAAVRYLRWRIDEELCFLHEARSRLKAIRDDKSASVEISVANVMSWLSTSTLHPAMYRTELAALSRVFAGRPSVADRISDTTSNAAGKAIEKIGSATKGITKRLVNLGRKNDDPQKH